MSRFLAFSWDTTDAAQSQAAETIAQRMKNAAWALGVFQPGFRLFHATPTASVPCQTLNDGAGIVLGWLFRKPSFEGLTAPTPAHLGHEETSEILRSHGTTLVSEYWGSFVAFLCCSLSDRVWVLRSPTGNYPCFRTTMAGVQLFFSHVKDLEGATGVRVETNWQQIRQRVVLGGPRNADTTLVGVTEVLGGQCVELRRSKSTVHWYWKPAILAIEREIEDIAEATRLIRATVISCTQAWKSAHPRLVHRLSGGLDSAIVLGALAHGRSDLSTVSCVAHYLPSGKSDGRPYARLAAELAKVPLVEHARAPETVFFKDLLAAPAGPRPLADHSWLEIGRMESSFALDRQATAIFTGDGGDSLFGRLSRWSAVLDYADRHGLTWQAIGLAARLAPMLDTTVWSLLSAVLRTRFDDRAATADPVLPTRLLPEREVVHEFRHDDKYDLRWSLPDQPISRHATLVLLAACQPRPLSNSLATDDCDPPFFAFPLFSQPVVDACVRIPSFLQLWNGTDRGIARAALADLLPPQVRKRQWKDRGVGASEATLSVNATFFRELLLDGFLVKERIVDPKAVTASLCGTSRKSAAYAGELFGAALLEIWLQVRAGTSPQPLQS